MNATSVKKVLILVTILAVPGFLYYFLQDQGKNRYKPLPFFGPKDYGRTFHTERGKLIADTIYHTARGFRFVDEGGNNIGWDAYKGKITIFHVFYTVGNSAAVAITNKAVSGLQDAYLHNRLINFIGISIDPVHDRPNVLTRYADSISARPGKWDLLTGDSIKVFKFIHGQLYIDAHQAIGSKGKKFLYSNMLVLVDPQHRIRGYYDASRHEAVSKLDDEIKVLIAEVLRNTEDGR